MRSVTWGVMPTCVLLLAWLFAADLRDMRRLSQNGKATQATITKMWAYELPTMPPSRLSPDRTGRFFSYWIKYEALGHTQEAQVAWEDYYKLAVGDSISVTVDPANPALSRIGTPDQFRRPMQAGILLIPTLLLWVTTVLNTEAKLRHQKRVLSEGIEIPGRITDTGGRWTSKASFRYQKPDGTQAQGSFERLSSYWVDTGQKVTVLYYEPKPSLSTVPEAISWVEVATST